MRKTCWCVKAAHPALLCASLHQPLVLLHIPIPGTETSDQQEQDDAPTQVRPLCCPSSHGGGRFPWPGWTKAALEMLCMRWTPQAPNCPRHWAGRPVRQGRELSRKEHQEHVFYRLSSELNGTSASDAKRHHPPSTPHSQLPTYMSICQLSSSCSVPVKSPQFSPLSVIMLNCWDQILVTLELPNNPLLLFYIFLPSSPY